MKPNINLMKKFKLRKTKNFMFMMMSIMIKKLLLEQPKLTLIIMYPKLALLSVQIIITLLSTDNLKNKDLSNVTAAGPLMMVLK